MLAWERKSFRELAAMQVALSIVAASVWFYFRTEAYLQGTPDNDLYAWSWSFQLMVFGLVWLPRTLLASAVLLLLEWTVLRLIARSSR